MIEIFNPGNDRFDLNGDVVLLPTLCDIDVSLDSVWSLELNHPIDKEGRWKSIVNNAVLQVTSFKLTSNERQLYRIRKVDVSDSGVKALAQPIWMDAQNEVFLVDVRPKKKTGQEALDTILKSNSKYKGSSNIAKKSTAYYLLKNAAEAIMGSDNSFLERWGGEILYDNYTIIINDKVGDDYGFEVVYGKNILVDGLKETIEIDDVVTRIVPKAFNGYTLAGTSPWVDSPLINSYPTIRTKVIEFPNIKLEVDVTEEDDTDDLIICPSISFLRTKLAEAARAEFNKGIDKPKVTIQCKLAALEKTEEYKQYKDLFKLGLGDTVHCRHNKLGIVTDARVRSVKWDCIKECIKDITIGDEYRSFVERVSSSIGATEKALTKAGSVKASRVSGTVDMGVAQLKYQKNIAQKQNVRAILFEDLDPDSNTYGAMCLGSLGFEIANTRTTDDRDWVWTTFGTAQGFTANLINAGTLTAINIEGSYIKGGTVEGTLVKGSTIDGNTIKGGEISGTKIIGAFIQGTEINGNNIFGSYIEGAQIVGSSIKTVSDPYNVSETIFDITDTWSVVDTSELKNGQFIQSSKWTGIDGYPDPPENRSYKAIIKSGKFFTFFEGTNSEAIEISDGITLYSGNSKYNKKFNIINGIQFGEAIGKNQILTINGGEGTGSNRISSDNDDLCINYTDITYTEGGAVTGPSYDWYFNSKGAIKLPDQGEIQSSGLITPPIGIAIPINHTCAGHITNSATSIDFLIPLIYDTRGLLSGKSTVTITSVSARSISGYVGGAQYITLSDYDITYYEKAVGFAIRLTKKSGNTGITNNTPLSVHIIGTYKRNS